MKNYIHKALITQFGEYLEGFNQKNIKFPSWTSLTTFSISDIKLKKDLLNAFDLPVKILYSNIGEMVVQASVFSLNSRPVVIDFKDVFILLGPKSKQEWSVVPQLINTEIKHKFLLKQAKRWLNFFQKKQSSTKDKTLGTHSTYLLYNSAHPQ